MLNELLAEAKELSVKNGFHITSACFKVAEKLSWDELKNLESELNNKRYSKLIRLAETSEDEKDRRYFKGSVIRYIGCELEVMAR